MLVAALKHTPFHAWQSLAEHEQHLQQQGRYGAVATFIGTMRDHNEGVGVQSLFLDHYPGMTEHYLQDLAQRAQRRWGLLSVLLLHRVGEIQIGDTIVLTAAWSGHRAEALAACQFLIEELKFNAPFWKREQLSDGRSRWVEKNTLGYQG
jgi:molybdopterin synthase catalytic subunit